MIMGWENVKLADCLDLQFFDCGFLNVFRFGKLLRLGVFANLFIYRVLAF